ncbi:putative leukotriene A-4 hydrolase [Apostichopus japonicus]|uniref:Leukotriene A(4) hydrolase n=1 Tax=Stichopus japonicus TaxID=307972 RepID=A0A2G8K7G3_STIJA|nr:putative leukotriene A-4 hydrolase [Apostichopus japonicus]
MDRRDDKSSLSTSSEEVVTENFSLEWNIRFYTKVISGEIVLDLKILRDGVSQLVLDTSDLQIDAVENTSNSEKLKFQLKEPHKCLGTPLEIILPSEVQKKDSKVSIKITYKTSPTASAVQWLKPVQTAGKKHPYLFSQCQAIHARSLMPCQDSPSVKSTYDAKVTVPRDLIALMSAERCGVEPSADPSEKTFLFKQKVPIPSYLLAVVVGKLESRKIGPRSLVWSEKEYVEDAEYEFSETENMLKAAEEILGPYEWGQYDLLILPPSFPYGGMENPCLTFITPTCLAGNRSLANVVAHEIAHSWTGNLVTNCSWEHFWLNEGFTVFAERKIIGRLQSKKHRDFHFIGGWKELHNEVQGYGAKHNYTKLIPNLEDVDPDDAYSRVPYEKGSIFLYYLEKLVGSEAEFEDFLKSYIQKFKFKSINTADWKSFFLSFFHEKESSGVFADVDWDQWFYGVGMPPVKPSLDTTLSSACSELCQKWSKAEEQDVINFSSVDIRDMDSGQIIEFLRLLLLEPPLTDVCVREMHRCFNFNASGNAEIKFRWLRLCLRASYEPCIPSAIEFATKWGRLKFTRPLFRDLFNFKPSHEKATSAFNDHKENMHPITSSMIAKDLKEIDG